MFSQCDFDDESQDRNYQNGKADLHPVSQDDSNNGPQQSHAKS